MKHDREGVGLHAGVNYDCVRATVLRGTKNVREQLGFYQKITLSGGTESHRDYKVVIMQSFGHKIKLDVELTHTSSYTGNWQNDSLPSS